MLKPYYNDTIAAISTPIGNGGISIIRLSGDEAINIVNKIFKGKDLSTVESHTINYGKIYEDSSFTINHLIDEVMVTVMKEPKTYTKENVVEINCHGGMFVTNKILETVLNNGARLAEVGEFTKRAFLNGRIDLTQAEAVMDVIEAKTKTTLKMANYGLNGHVKRLIENFRSKLLKCISEIEVNIDYPEYEDEIQVTNNILKPNILELRKEISKIIEKSEASLLIKQGIKTAIIGKPNVGKSSLLNALLKEDKAIVTAIAGTTRDIVEGTININGLVLDLIDTAGIRETSDVVEKIGVEKTKDIIQKAELIILVFDYSSKLDKNDLLLLELTKDKKRIIVINKNDLNRNIELDILKDYLLLSSFNNKDIEKLEQKIKETVKILDINDIDATYLGNARQISMLKQAELTLNNCIKGLDQGFPIDIVNIDITLAWKILGEIIGETSSDELMNELFSKFCLGK